MERLERVASAREATSSKGGWGFPSEGTSGDRGKKVFWKGKAGSTGALPAGGINRLFPSSAQLRDNSELTGPALFAGSV